MKRVAVKYGSWMLIGFTALFLLLHLVGLSTCPNLRVFITVIHFTLIYFALWNYLRQLPVDLNNLTEDLIGLDASPFRVTCFALFPILFLELNPEMLAILQSELTGGQYIASVTAISVIIIVEGIGINLIDSFLVNWAIDKRLAQPYSS